MEVQAQLAKKDSFQLPPHDRGLFWGLIILTLILLAVSVSIFGSGTEYPIASESATPLPSDTQPPRVYTVSYRVGVFSPTNLRIHAGDTVRFRNDGIVPIHIVTDGSYAGFDSVGDLPSGGVFSFTFAAKGTFGYYNKDKPSETGTIIVR